MVSSGHVPADKLIVLLEDTVFYRLIAKATSYKFQVEIGVVTNQDFYIKTACK